MEIGAELRIARVSSGHTQREVGHAVGRSASRISRIEGGRVPRISVMELSTVAAAVGMKLYVRVYPGGHRPLDAPQLALLAAFNARIHAHWRRQLEAPMPIPGDLRAVDELIRTDGCSCAVEAYTRLADIGRQLRLSRTKQRDIKADRLIWVVKGSRANRRLLHEAGPLLVEELPVATRVAMRALAAGEDPGADCLVIL
jgi:transcriptional regulator with XRE-family HTH domain